MTKTRDDAPLTRRGMLMKLGLAATAAYAAPSVLRLNPAHASGGSGGSRGSGGSGRGGWGGGSRGSYGRSRDNGRDTV